jgi:hypothetical protein
MKVWLAALVCAVVCGCGKGSGPPKVQAMPVKGKVTLDGKPLAGAEVVFSVIYPPAVFASRTKDDGTYELQGLAGMESSLAGDCKVTISRMVKPGGSPLGAEEAPANVGATEQLPANYSQIGATTLSANVGAAGGTFDFDLKSK